MACLHVACREPSSYFSFKSQVRGSGENGNLPYPCTHLSKILLFFSYDEFSRSPELKQENVYFSMSFESQERMKKERKGAIFPLFICFSNPTALTPKIKKKDIHVLEVYFVNLNRTSSHAHPNSNKKMFIFL